MTKEEIIKEAFNYGYNSYHECNTYQDYERHLKDCIESFKDTEDNNSWIKIESDKPNFDEYCYCWILTIDGDVVLREWNPHSKGFYGPVVVNFTHYQPIEKPKPPIY